MKIKNLLFLTVIFTSLIQPVIHTEAPLTQKEKVIKGLKIAGYIVEVGISGIIYIAINMNSGKDNSSLFYGLPKHVKDEEYDEALQIALLQVPFLGSIGHAAHGLYTELAPIAKTLWNKDKKVAPVIAEPTPSEQITVTV